MSIYSDIEDIMPKPVDLESIILDYIAKEILADLYKESASDVARLCDEKLDKSDVLLGKVREYARYGE